MEYGFRSGDMFIPDHSNPKWPSELVKEWAGGNGYVENPEIVDFVIRREFGDKYLEALFLVYACGWSHRDACHKCNINDSLFSRKRRDIINRFRTTWEWRHLMTLPPFIALDQMSKVYAAESYAEKVAAMSIGLKPRGLADCY